VIFNAVLDRQRHAGDPDPWRLCGFGLSAWGWAHAPAHPSGADGVFLGGLGVAFCGAGRLAAVLNLGSVVHGQGTAGAYNGWV